VSRLRPYRKAGRQRRDDALARAKWLTSQTFTLPGGVALLGWSNGGSTVLTTIRESASLPAPLLRRAVAFYPGCRILLANMHWHLSVKPLILIGDADNSRTPTAPCRELVACFPGRIALMTYPVAYHDFDVPGRPVRVRNGLAYTGAGSGAAHGH
jgi:dienelactone hydrolase